MTTPTSGVFGGRGQDRGRALCGRTGPNLCMKWAGHNGSSICGASELAQQAKADVDMPVLRGDFGKRAQKAALAAQAN
jgi:hypothetical protein